MRPCVYLGTIIAKNGLLAMKLGTKLILYLVGTVIIVMSIHAYFSIQQDKDDLSREIRIGMRALSRSLEARFVDSDGADEGPNSKNLQEFVDRIGPKGNSLGLVIYDLKTKPIAVSVSLRDTKDNPELDPGRILQLDPAPVLNDAHARDGYTYVRGDNPVYYRIDPIFDSGHRLVGAFVLARQGAGPSQAVTMRRNRNLATTFILMAALSVPILVVVRRNVSQPINRLIERIRRTGAGNWEQRIEVSGGKEISALAHEFNLMGARLQEFYTQLVHAQEERIQLERDLRHSEKLASVGQLATGLAHEIGTPLNIISGRAEYLLRRPRSPEEISENLHTIQSQIDRIAGIVRQLLEFSRRKEPNFRRVDIASIVTGVPRLLQHKIDEKSIQVLLSTSPPLPKVWADPDLLQQVFVNLFMNSVHALDPNGSIHIETALLSSDGPQGNRVRICFEDNGQGIPANDLDRVFDPFFTTKDVGEGTGLGLSVSYGIVKEHGGEIHVESEPGRFTRFTIILPLDPRPLKEPLHGAEAR